MRGTVEIDSLEELALFINSLIISGTAVFKVYKQENHWIVEFTGGYQ